MSKYLIINADDCGMCHSANEAVFDLFEKNKLFSTTVMMPCPTAKEAVDFSVAHPEYAMGVHLTLTSEWGRYRWKPLTDSPSLIDEDGYMWHESYQVGFHAKTKEVEKELRAQIELAQSWGMKPSHVDNHMGSLYGYTGRFSFPKLTLKLMREYGYAYRFFTDTAKSVCMEGIPYPLFASTKPIVSSWVKKSGVIVPDFLMLPKWTDDLKDNGYKNYRDKILKIWTSIPDGVTETFIHPALESDEIKGITSLWHCRVWEHDVMEDDYTHEYLEKHGVKLISYRDLIKMKTGK